MIIIAGEKASPREIEDMLMRHPAVAEAAVVAKKDPARGEVAVAFVIVKENHSAKFDDSSNRQRDVHDGGRQSDGRGHSCPAG